LGNETPGIDEVRKILASQSQVRCLQYDAGNLEDWDSALLTFLFKVSDLCARHQIPEQREGLPTGVQRLMALAAAIPEKKGARRKEHRPNPLARIGSGVLTWLGDQRELLTFLGETWLALWAWVRGRAQYRRVDLWEAVQECGVQSLPIVTLISVLIGLILAFVGAFQLAMFGAQIYVADLVGVGMVREMAPLMTGIIMSGRVGSAFAARLGTMQVNEEIDAFKTLGLAPMEFLVLPRVLALSLMMPLLCIYSDFLGIAGGAFVGIGIFGISPMEYWTQSRAAIGLDDISIGIFKSVIFGGLIAIAGCMSGIRCGRSALAVGTATTTAVVQAIVWIIVTDSIFAIISSVAGI
jgi:phospholipid/cholesterol/gamma-HCH transport system permease protein